jgi:hypothetical protein
LEIEDEDDDEDDSWNLRPSPNLWGNRLVFVFFAFLAVRRPPVVSPDSGVPAFQALEK